MQSTYWNLEREVQQSVEPLKIESNMASRSRMKVDLLSKHVQEPTFLHTACLPLVPAVRSLPCSMHCTCGLPMPL
jgi:hypothetical protein